MSEIPEELKGWNAYADAKRTASNAYDASLIEFGFEDQLRILKAIEYGVLLERQRCAKIAENGPRSPILISMMINGRVDLDEAREG